MKRKISVVLAIILVFVAIFSGVPLKHASASVTGTADQTVSAAVIKGDKGADGIWFKTDQADDLAYDTTKIGYADFETKNVGLIGDGCVNEYWADADSIFITDLSGAKSGEIVQADGNKKLKVTVTSPTNVALGMGLFGLEMDNTPRYRGSMEATIQADFVSSSQSSTISITAGGEKTTVILDDTGCYTGKIEIADMAVEVLSDSTSSPWICPYAIRPVIQIDDTSVISSLTVTIDNFSVYEKRYVATFEQKSTGLIGDGWDDGNTILQFATDRAEIVEEDGDKKLTIPFETLFDIWMGMDLFGAPMTEEEYGAIMDISVSADFAEGQTPCESTISILKDDVEWKEIGKIQLNQEGTYSGTVKLSEIGFKKPSTENTSPWICPYAVRMLFSIDDRALLSGATVTIDNFELIPANRGNARVTTFEGGIYRNEKQVSGAILSKVAGDEYFIDLSQTNAKPKEGMQIVLDGIFGTDSYKVRFDKNVFEFRDGAWSIVKETDIQLNVQKVMNVTDTNGIWFKSNQADELAYNISEIGCVDFEAKNVGEIGDGCANEYWAGADSIFITDSLGAKGGKIVQVDGNKKLQVTVTNPTNIALGMGLFGLEMDNTPRYRGSMEATIQADFVSSSQNSTISVTAGGEKTTVTLDDTGCYTGKVELADVAVERLSGDDAGGIWWCPYAIRPVIQIDDTSVISSLTVTIDNFTVYEKGYVATFESENTGSLGDGWKDGNTILTNDTAQSEIVEMDGNKKLKVPFSQFTTIQMGMEIFGAPMVETLYSATVDVSISADFAKGQTPKASTISVFDNTWNWSQIGTLQLDSEGIYSGTLELSQVPMRQLSSETRSPYICPYAVTLGFNIDDRTLLSGATVTIDNFELIPPDRDTTRPDAILGGVYQGGELLSDMQLKKVAEDEYFIDLNQAGIVPAEGMQIVLDGIYEKDDYQVMFYMTTFEYENGAWNIKVLQGDANNDAKFDVKDLVRMKKYMTHPSRNRISMTNADWNSDGAIDETDATLTRESLIGKKNFINGSNVTPGEPQLLAKADLPIGAYCGPSRSSNGVDYRTAEQFAQYANAGFNYVISERDAVYGHDYKADGSEKTYIDFASSDLKKYLDLAKAADIDVIVHNQEINDALRSGTGISNGKLSDELKKNIDTMLLDMKGVENFKGILMADEPSDSNQLYYEVVSNYLKNAENMKGKCLYSSLLPYWAGEEAFDSYEGSTKQEKYKGYLKSMSSILGMTNYDFYPFQTNGIRAEWLQNLEMAATVASGKNDVGITLQSTAMSNTAGDAIYRAMDKKAYITYQLYSAMAYGIKNVAFFTYWKHPGSGTVNEVFSNNMVNDDGTINEAVYNAVRDANQEIRAFDDIYMDFSWQGTMKLVNGDEEGILNGISNYQSMRISEATSTEDSIIGCLKNSMGYDGFIIVNVLDPIKTKESTVTVKFQHATKVIAYIGGKKQIVSLNDGTYTATVQPGEGIFVIPYTE